MNKQEQHEVLQMALEALKKVFDPFDTEDMRGGSVSILPSQAIKGLETIAALKSSLAETPTLKEAMSRQGCEKSTQQGEPVVWMQSNHLDKFKHNACGSESMLARCSVRQLHPDYKPLYTSAPTIPEGWQLVPKELTPEMIVAGERERRSHVGNMNPVTTYKAMLSAAPIYGGEL